MKRKYSAILITLCAAFAAFLSVGYMACKKDTVTVDHSCDSVACKNGGTCFKGSCSYPAGTEGIYCQSRIILRYTGTWSVTENILGSDSAAAIGSTKSYTMVIKESSNTDLLIDDFMGNDAYDNVKAKAGKDAYLDDVVYTRFGFVREQIIAGTKISIVSGSGKVNDAGNFLDGSYIRSYPGGAGYIKDTVTFSADRLQ